MDMSDLLYRNHNIAVMLAAKLAAELGLDVGVGEDPLGLGWPVLYIVLPTGEQVAWRLPPEELVGVWPEFRACHDGHTPDERSARLLSFLKGDAPPTPPPNVPEPSRATRPALGLMFRRPRIVPNPR
jgi:hypothetical protein